ncbi:sigma-E factor negative regulatory protein [Thalassomonas sp. M1454]|uniref:sigma-E factor negative regulatory protein n=1 Tax=Thalassomonas sp. M1454 TaxID=2594477 RepID=UPI001180DFA8|nr:RseA family anti-sigma factor [Thalassomonas sp. M1454]TRX54533.1 transcriptional regulator [Thalassomonas sp. M1454]
MNENKLQAVSSLLDQQQVDEDLLKQVIDDEKLNESWSRYHLIGDIMRGETADFIDTELSQNIASAIAAEPTLLAPKAKQSVSQKVKAKVVQLGKPLGQFAIAASAAGLMILGVQQANNPDDMTAVPAQVWQPLPMGGVADPVSYNYSRQDTALPSQQKRAQIERQQKLQAILADHQMQTKLNSKATVTDDSEQVELIDAQQPNQN